MGFNSGLKELNKAEIANKRHIAGRIYFCVQHF